MTADVQRFRLSVMMFGQYLVIGSWMVTLATYLMSSPIKGGLNFTASQTGWIYSTVALAGILAPLLIGLMADRLFASEKLMGCLHLLGAILLIAAGGWCQRQQPLIETAFRDAAAREMIDGRPILDVERDVTNAPSEIRQAVEQGFERINQSAVVSYFSDETFWTLLCLMFAYAFCLIITLTLSNVIAFRNLADPQHTFGRVRLYGTIGWIVSGVQLELFWNTISPAPLYVSGVLSLIFGTFCFFLPNTRPTGGHRSIGEAFGLPALSMFRDRSFTVLIICVFGIAAVQQFYGIYTNLYLNDLHAPYPAAVQTIAQVSEVICLILTPLFIRYLGLKRTMLLGLVCWIARNGLFATENLPLVVLCGLPLHGVSYTFFMVVASMYVDKKAPLTLRASAQGIFTIFSMGLGTLLGNWLSSAVVRSQSIGDVIDWRTVWSIPTVTAGAFLIVFLVLFREDAPVRSTSDS